MFTCIFSYNCRRVGCNCRYSAAIADARLQLQMCSAAIADARLQLQNYSVAIADCKYTLQALRPRGDRSKKQLSCNCRLQMHSAGSPPKRGSEQKQLSCNCRLQMHSAGSPPKGGVRAKIAQLALQIANALCRPPAQGRGSSQDSSVAIADCKYTLQAPHPGGGG